MSNTILLVEDEENDVFFLKYAFKEVGILNPLQVAEDGQEALDYLSGHGEYADREQFPLPCLILLDLKLPRVMGFEVLQWIREQPALKTLIVIILTSSRLEPDIEKAYKLGANAYLVKPSTPPELRGIAKAIKEFWLELNHGPGAFQESRELVAPATECGEKQQAEIGRQTCFRHPAGRSFQILAKTHLRLSGVD